MVAVKQWARLLRHHIHLRRICVPLVNAPSYTVRQRSESKVIPSPFLDMEMPSGLIDEFVWGNLEKWADKDALVSRFYIEYRI